MTKIVQPKIAFSIRGKTGLAPPPVAIPVDVTGYVLKSLEDLEISSSGVVPYAGTISLALDDVLGTGEGAITPGASVSGTVDAALDDSTMVAVGSEGTLAFWEQQGVFPGVTPNRAATNTRNNDVIISQGPSGGEVGFYNLEGGAGPFSALPTLTRGGSLHQGIAVDESSGDRAGDVWSVHANTTEIDHLPNGVGSWGTLLTYPGTNLTGIAINSTTGDLWVADSAEDGVYHYDLSTTTWSALFPILSTGGIGAIDVDDSTGDVYIYTSGGLSDPQIEILTGGVGLFTVHAVENAWEVVTGISVSPVTGDIWVVDNLYVGSGGLVYLQTAGAGSFVVQGAGRSWVVPIDISHNSSDGSTWVTDAFEPDDGQMFKNTKGNPP